MKISELMRVLEKARQGQGDSEVYVEAEFDGARTQQKAAHVISNSAKCLILSNEAWIADPINELPVMPDEEPLQ